MSEPQELNSRNWVEKWKRIIGMILAYVGIVLGLPGTGMIDTHQKVLWIQFHGVMWASFVCLLGWYWLRITIVEWSNSRLLAGVVRKASGLADKLELLTFYFLEDSVKPKPKLHGVLWTLHELTEFEKVVPQQCEVLIERPSAIETQSSPDLNQVMKANGNRSVEYKILDQRMPIEWEGMSHVTLMTPKHRSQSATGATASLVLPSYGMVLYKFPYIEGAASKPITHPEVWHQHSYARMGIGAFWIAGFVLIPIPQGSGASDSYLALHMRHGDIDELIHRIF